MCWLAVIVEEQYIYKKTIIFSSDLISDHSFFVQGCGALSDGFHPYRL